MREKTRLDDADAKTVSIVFSRISAILKHGEAHGLSKRLVLRRLKNDPVLKRLNDADQPVAR